LGGHQEDPQTLNRYVYVRNNPLKFTDPTGLDFNLGCTPTKDNSSTCQNGIQGKTDENGRFAATVISSNVKGNLVDQYGNQYNAGVSGAGVSFTQVGSEQSSMGVFINGTDATTIQGSGDFEGFTFTFTESRLASHVNAAGTFTYTGNYNRPKQLSQRRVSNATSWTRSICFTPPHHGTTLKSSGAPVVGARAEVLDT